MAWPDISYGKIWGRKLLITGDVRTGKTRMTRNILEITVASAPGEITVIDMAPRAVTVNGLPVGGTLMREGEFDARLLRSEPIVTPRLSARTGAELFELAEINRHAIQELLDAFHAKPSRILFVNDVSIYLQRGNLESLWTAFELAETVIANGYIGESLREDLWTGISSRERRLMKALARRMDQVIRL